MHCQCNLKCLHSYFWRQHNCVCGVFEGSPSAAAWCPVLHCRRWTEARIGKDATSLMSMWRDSLSTAPHTHWPAHEESLSTAPPPPPCTHTDQYVKRASPQPPPPPTHTHTPTSMWRDSLSTAPHTHWPASEESLSTATGVLTNTTSVVHSLHVAFVYKLCIDYSDPHSVDRDIHWLLWPTFSG